MGIRLDGRVAIVTGAGGGLGRAHALALAARGAKVVVNDLGGPDGVSANAEAVVEEIRKAGGAAIAHGTSVTDEAGVEDMVAKAMTAWGRIDILVNNAGILRDKSFAKMDLADFRLVLDVHLMGSAICTKKVWEIMRAQNYGRIVMTTSSSGLYGNFGQSNYGAAKMALVGLMQTLALEGAKNDIRVNCLAPTAATQMTENILPPEMLKLFAPELVSPGLLALVAEDAPTRTILCAGAGTFAAAYVTLTQGANFGAAPDADAIAEGMAAVTDRTGEVVPENGALQSQMALEKAMAGR